MCKCTPEMITPFCGKPGCEWPAQTATQMRDREIGKSLLGDVRMRRAQVFVAQIMRIIERDICDHTEDTRVRQRLQRDLISVFYGDGFDIVTDQDRSAAGLSLRGDMGWTYDELRVLERQRLEWLARPVGLPRRAFVDQKMMGDAES